MKIYIPLLLPFFLLTVHAWNYEYENKGCFEDNNRALFRVEKVEQTQLSSCARKCVEEEGSTFMAYKNQNECFCGSQHDFDSLDQEDVSLECENGMGSADAFDVYRIKLPEPIWSVSGQRYGPGFAKNWARHNVHLQNRAFSITARVHVYYHGRDHHIFGMGVRAGIALVILPDGRLMYSELSTGIRVTFLPLASEKPLEVGKAYDVAVVRIPHAAYLYVDGAQVGYTEYNMRFIGAHWTSWIGTVAASCRKDPWAYWTPCYEGDINDLRIYPNLDIRPFLHDIIALRDNCGADINECSISNYNMITEKACRCDPNSETNECKIGEYCLEGNRCEKHFVCEVSSIPNCLSCVEEKDRTGHQQCSTCSPGYKLIDNGHTCLKINLYDVLEEFDFDTAQKVVNQDQTDFVLSRSFSKIPSQPWLPAPSVTLAEWTEPANMPYSDETFELSKIALHPDNIDILKSVLEKTEIETTGQFVTLSFRLTNEERVMVEVKNEGIKVDFIGMWGPDCSLENTFTNNEVFMETMGKNWASFNMEDKTSSPVEFCVGVLTNIEEDLDIDLNVRLHKFTRTRKATWDEEQGKHVLPLCYSKLIYGGSTGDNVGSSYEDVSGTCHVNYSNRAGRNKGWCSYHAASAPKEEDLNSWGRNHVKGGIGGLLYDTREWIPADNFCHECRQCNEERPGAFYRVRVKTSEERRNLQDIDMDSILREKIPELDAIEELAETYGTRLKKTHGSRRRRNLKEIDARRGLMTKEEWCAWAKDNDPDLFAMYCVKEESKGYQDIIYSVQLGDLDEATCNRFRHLSDSVTKDSLDSEKDIKMLTFQHFCHDYRHETETIWAIGAEGETCLELCTGMEMITTNEVPYTKNDFEDIMISYEHRAEDEENGVYTGTALAQKKSIMDYCVNGLYSSSSYSAPEMLDGYCFWASKYMNANYNRDGMRTSESESSRRFCSCSKIVDDASNVGRRLLNMKHL